MEAQCMMNNCRNRAPATEAFCAQHRNDKKPFAYCCAGPVSACDCVNKDHGEALYHRKEK